MIAARGRQRPDTDRLATCGVDAEDLVELTDSVAAAELVDKGTDSDRGTVVEDSRQATDRPRAATDDRPDVCGRGVRGVEPAEKKNPASEGRDRRVLNRDRERTGGTRADAQRADEPCARTSRGFPAGRSRRSRPLAAIRIGCPDSGCACGGGEQQRRDRDATPALRASPPLGTRDVRVRHGHLGCPSG